MAGGDGTWADSCDLPGVGSVTFDVSAAAPVYATATGGLLALAVTAVVIVFTVTDGLREHDSNRRGLAILVVSLVPLALATIVYGELAGTVDCQRAAIETVGASFLFASGAIMPFLAIRELVLARSATDDVLARVVSTIVKVGLLLATVFTWVGLDTVHTLFLNVSLHERRTGWTNAVVLIGGLLAGWTLSRRVVATDDALRRCLNVILFSCVVGVVAFLLAGYAKFESGVSEGVIQAVVWTRTVLWIVVLGALAWIAGKRPPPTNRPPVNEPAPVDTEPATAASAPTAGQPRSRAVALLLAAAMLREGFSSRQ